MNPSFDFVAPDHFTVGTVGPPGERTFYLQVGTAGSIAAFKLEKQQVAALADYLGRVLSDLPEPEAPPLPAPELVDPVASEWTIGGVGIAVDESADRVLLIIHELVVVEVDDVDDLDEGLEDAIEDSDVDAASARVRVTRAQVAAFIARARDLLAAGRPLCPFCGLPDGPDGHFCPRAN